MPRMIIFAKSNGYILRDAMEPGRFDPELEDRLPLDIDGPMNQRDYRVDPNTEQLRPATPAEQAEYDADKLDAEEASALDIYRMVRSLGYILMDEINILREAHHGPGVLPAHTKDEIKRNWHAQYRKLQASLRVSAVQP
jgi:hypothetical protein